MDKTNMPTSYGVLHAWRTKVLNIFLTVIVIASAPALIALIINQTRSEKTHP